MKNMLIKKPCCDYPVDYQFNGIDIVKFICAFLVCIIHIPPFKIDLFGFNNLNFWLRIICVELQFRFTLLHRGFYYFAKLILIISMKAE